MYARDTVRRLEGARFPCGRVVRSTFNVDYSCGLGMSALSRSVVLPGSPAWTVFLLSVIIALFIVVVATSHSRCRHSDRSAGRFAASGCANPTHGVLKSSEKAELRTATPYFALYAATH